MKLKTIKGKERNVKIIKYLVKWDDESLSKFQFNVKQFFKPLWQTDPAVVEEFPVTGTRLRVDLINFSKKIAIEIQGDQHQGYKNGKLHWFHGNDPNKYLDQIKRDVAKEKWCEVNGLTLIEIYPEDMPLNRGFFLKKYNLEV